jgi:hypothetical protein
MFKVGLEYLKLTLSSNNFTKHCNSKYGFRNPAQNLPAYHQQHTTRFNQIELLEGHRVVLKRKLEPAVINLAIAPVLQNPSNPRNLWIAGALVAADVHHKE